MVPWTVKMQSTDVNVSTFGNKLSDARLTCKLVWHPQIVPSKGSASKVGCFWHCWLSGRTARTRILADYPSAMWYLNKQMMNSPVSLFPAEVLKPAVSNCAAI